MSQRGVLLQLCLQRTIIEILSNETRNSRILLVHQVARSSASIEWSRHRARRRCVVLFAGPVTRWPPSLFLSLAKRSFINRYARAKGYGRRKTPGAETLLHYSRLFVYINVETLDTMRVCVRDIASHRVVFVASRRRRRRRASGRGGSVSSVCTRSRRAHARSGEREAHWMKFPHHRLRQRRRRRERTHAYAGIGVSDKRRVRRVVSRARLHDAAQNAHWKLADRDDCESQFSLTSNRMHRPSTFNRL